MDELAAWQAANRKQREVVVAMGVGGVAAWATDTAVNWKPIAAGFHATDLHAAVDELVANLTKATITDAILNAEK